jgi:hypothetical protein
VPVHVSGAPVFASGGVSSSPPGFEGAVHAESAATRIQIRMPSGVATAILSHARELPSRRTPLRGFDCPRRRMPVDLWRFRFTSCCCVIAVLPPGR